jgi:hypothetical protein
MQRLLNVSTSLLQDKVTLLSAAAVYSQPCCTNYISITKKKSFDKTASG